MSDAIAGRRLSEAEKRVGGSLVHYAFGDATGAFYGVLCETRPEAAVGGGLPFGAAVWLVADEVGVPLAGFADNPLQYPVARHASALATHLAFGATVEAARRMLLGSYFLSAPTSPGRMSGAVGMRSNPTSFHPAARRRK